MWPVPPGALGIDYLIGERHSAAAGWRADDRDRGGAGVAPVSRCRRRGRTGCRGQSGVVASARARRLSAGRHRPSSRRMTRSTRPTTWSTTATDAAPRDLSLRPDAEAGAAAVGANETTRLEHDQPRLSGLRAAPAHRSSASLASPSSGAASTKSRAGASSAASSGRPLRSIAPTNRTPPASSTVRTVGRANAARTVRAPDPSGGATTLERRGDPPRAAAADRGDGRAATPSGMVR